MVKGRPGGGYYRGVIGAFASLRPTPPIAETPPLAQRGIIRVAGPESDRNLTAGHQIFSIPTLVKPTGLSIIHIRPLAKFLF